VGFIVEHSVYVEVSALSGDNVDEIFARLARMILTKIELGEVDPDDPQSGIQYGDSGTWGIGTSDGGSIKSGVTAENRVGRERGKEGRGLVPMVGRAVSGNGRRSSGWTDLVEGEKEAVVKNAALGGKCWVCIWDMLCVTRVQSILDNG
jgi:hypothetical protein